MIDQIQSGKNTEKKGIKEVLLNRKTLVPFVAILALGGANVLRGDNDPTGPKQPETLTPAELAAKTEAHTVFENLKPSDIVHCQVTGVEAGPKATYNNRTTPSLEITMTVEPGERYDDKWLADGGNRTGNYWAEVKWQNPGLRVAHDLDGSGEYTTPGAAVLDEEFQPKADIESQGIQSPLLMTRLNNEVPRRVTYIVPINDRMEGKRSMRITEDASEVYLAESGTGTDQSAPEGKRLEETCATIELDVETGKVRVTSALDKDGQLIATKN